MATEKINKKSRLIEKNLTKNKSPEIGEVLIFFKNIKNQIEWRVILEIS